MLLRRVIVHLRKQEWTAIAIDFVIVVLGVLLGLQANEWGASQADVRRGEAYAERLVAEIEENLGERRQLLAYYEAVYASAEISNTFLEQTTADPASLIVNVYRASEYSYNAPTRSIWDEIVSSGDIGLLPRDAISALGDYFSDNPALRAAELMSHSSYRSRVRTTIPHDVQTAIRDRCGDVRNERGDITGVRDDCDLQVDQARLAEVARALRQDPGVQSDLAYQFSFISIALANLRGDIASLEEALIALEGEQSR
ncbi:MAG: hypothetical protein R3C30_06425 [Hyphomonadaceae bacterium]